VPDVLRGEETQAIGAMASLPPGAVSVWQPGTHSKHLRIRDGVIEGFATFMTGEIFSLLSEQSILGRLADGTDIDLQAFDEGARRAGQPGGLLHHVFGVRSRVLTGEIRPRAVRGYLSGILIGHELLADLPAAGHPVHVMGDPELAALYVRALNLHGVEATSAGVDLAAAGLARLRHAMDGRVAI
jgi:2-dehydro-3-deoxygalactonokinase